MSALPYAQPAAGGGGLALQRQEAAEPAQPAAEDRPATSAAAGSTPAGAPAAPGGHSEKELDDLARQLYDRFRIHLRSELLIDRERVGMLVDRR